MTTIKQFTPPLPLSFSATQPNAGKASMPMLKQLSPSQDQVVIRFGNTESKGTDGDTGVKPVNYEAVSYPTELYGIFKQVKDNAHYVAKKREGSTEGFTGVNTWPITLAKTLLLNDDVEKYLAQQNIEVSNLLKMFSNVDSTMRDKPYGPIEPNASMTEKQKSLYVNHAFITDDYFMKNIWDSFRKWVAGGGQEKANPVDAWRWVMSTLNPDAEKLMLRILNGNKELLDQLRTPPIQEQIDDELGFLQPTPADYFKVKQLEQLDDIVIGQDHMTDFLMTNLRTSIQKLKLGDEKKNPHKPIFVFTLFGPSGTGKTFSIETIFDLLDLKEHDVITVACNEFLNDSAVTRITGASPGHVGYNDGSSVAEQQWAINQRKGEDSGFFRSGLLIDEIEKAWEHAPGVVKSFMRILDKGRIQASNSKQASFRGAVVGITSNLVQTEIKEWMEEKNDDGSAKYSNDEIATMAEEKLKELLAPEIFGRSGTKLFVKAFNVDDVKKIMMFKLNEMVEAATEQWDVNVDLTPEAIDWLAEKAFDPNTNARNVKQVFENDLHTPLAAKHGEIMEEGRKVSGGKLIVKVEEGGYRLKVEEEGFMSDAEVAEAEAAMAEAEANAAQKTEDDE